MTRRHAEKGAVERPAVRDARTKPAAARGTPGKLDVTSSEKHLARSAEALEARLRALETEREGLLSQIETLQQRCRQLEDNAAHVRNRLAWAIDSVESVLQSKG